MADPLRQPTVLPQPTWVRPCQLLWSNRSVLWSLVILPFVINLYTSWFTTPPGSISSHTPFGIILEHPLSSALVGFGPLAVIYGGLWLINRRYPAPQTTSPLPLTPDRRQRLEHTLDWEYTKQFAQVGTTRIVPRLRARNDVVLPSTQMSSLSPGASIQQAYDGAERRLLILGMHGAGKTTLLLDLARKLLNRDEHNPTDPLPVILDLSSWAAKKPPLASWVIDELHRLYRVPTRLGQTLLDQCVLLLDGLDEIEASALSQCIEAINCYQEEHDIPLVVCSRRQEYVTQQARLTLSRAVEIQPLQEQEAIDYLERIGTPMAALRDTLRANPELRQLLTTPLMLNVLSRAYRNKTVKNLSTLSTVEEQQRQIFTGDVECMLEQLVTRSHFTSQQTRKWLIWLAQQMEKRGPKEFYLEDLQVSWILPGQLGGCWPPIIGLFIIGLLSWLSAKSEAIGSIVLIFIATCNLPVMWLWIRGYEIRPQGDLTWSWKRFRTALIGGLIAGLIFELIGGLIAALTSGLTGSPIEWLGGLLIVELIAGLTSGLVVGLSNEQIDEDRRTTPNQGIRNAGWNGLCRGLITALVIALIIGLSGGTLIAGLIIGLIVGLIVGWFRGGRDYLQHYVLRYGFWRSGAMPWHYVRFLEEAHEHFLLQRIGGGYRFRHQLLQDYFASLGTETSSRTHSHPSSLQP